MADKADEFFAELVARNKALLKDRTLSNGSRSARMAENRRHIRTLELRGCKDPVTSSEGVKKDYSDYLREH